MSCELTNSALHGYLDGELDAARAADFERHLISCGECVAALEAQENLRSTIQSARLYEPAPASLRQKLNAAIGVQARSSRSAPMAFPRMASWGWLAAAAALLIAALLVWRWPSGTTADREAPLAATVVDAHLRSLQPGHLEDVVSTDQHTVKPWFDGKVDFAPPVRDFAEQGFPLQGGRLDVIRGRNVAVLVYTRRKHIINVFVWPTTEKESESAVGTQLGYHWIDWRKAGMEMCAVSDVSAPDLVELQRLLSN